MSRMGLAHVCLAYGFLGGKEIQQAGLGNLGLHDREYRLSACLWNSHVLFVSLQNVKLCDG